MQCAHQAPLQGLAGTTLMVAALAEKEARAASSLALEQVVQHRQSESMGALPYEQAGGRLAGDAAQPSSTLVIVHTSPGMGQLAPGS